MLPFIAAFTAPIVSGLFGAEVNEGEFARKLRAAPARRLRTRSWTA
jgi:hypothetical protein